MDDVLTLDGAHGEGGGQILRTALSLSTITRRAFRLINLRAGRHNPGLLPQHLSAVRAATATSSATVSGDQLERLRVARMCKQRRLCLPLVRKISVDEGDCHAAFSDSRRDPFDQA